MGLPEPALIDPDTEARGPARFRVAQGPRAQAIARRRMEADLRRAMDRGAVSLHYQPRVALASGEARGAEALLRWSDRRRGLVSPAQFIPVAERSDLIVDLGDGRSAMRAGKPSAGLACASR